MSKYMLSSIDVFKGLDESELETMEKGAKEINYTMEKTIFKEGDPGDKMYMILDGVVEIWKSEGKEPKGSRLARLKTGEIFGEMALFDKEPRSATAIAAITKETKLLIWHEKDMDQIIQTTPRLGLKILTNIIKKVSTRLRVANDAIHTLLRSNQYIGL